MNDLLCLSFLFRDRVNEDAALPPSGQVIESKVTGLERGKGEREFSLTNKEWLEFNPGQVIERSNETNSSGE